MLEDIKNLFKKEFQLSHVAVLLNQMHQMLSVFRADFMSDANEKNAAIDALCKLLQDQKDPVTPAIPDNHPVTPPVVIPSPSETVNG